MYRVMKMYKYTDEDRSIISRARKENKNKRVEKRLYALELRASGMSAREISEQTGFHSAYITQLSSKYRHGGIEAITGNKGKIRTGCRAQYWREPDLLRTETTRLA